MPTTAGLNRGNTLPIAAPTSRDRLAQLRLLVERNSRRWKRLIVLEAISLVVAAPLAYLWLVFLLDNQFHLPVAGRLAANLGFFAGVLGLAVWLVRRWRQIHFTEDQVALAIEQRTPGGVQNRLINAVQIAREHGPDVELSEAVVEENYSHLRELELWQAGESKPALIRSAVAAGLVAAGIVCWGLRPEQFSNAAARILLPLADIDPIYRTTLTVDPGDVEAVGDVTITIHIQGQRPETLTVLTNLQGKRSAEVIAVDEDAEEVRYTFRDLRQSMTYAVRGNDYTTPYYRIDVPTEPQLSVLRAAYQFPEYTRLPERKFEKAGGDLEALQGTTARVVFVLDQPVDQSALLLERVALPKKVNGSRTATHRLELSQLSPTVFEGTIHFQDVTGYQLETTQAGRSPHQGPRYSLRVHLDQEPKLELTGLERQTEVQVDSRLPLQISAADDYGLQKVGLFVRRAGQEANGDDPEGWQPVVVWPVPHGLTFRQNHALAVSSLNAPEGEKLEMALRGVDSDPLKAGRWTTGAIYTLLVGGEGVGLQLTYERIRQTEADLKGLARAQDEVTAGVAEWIGKLDGDGNLRWDDPKNLDALHAAVKVQRQAQERVRQLAGKAARDMVPQAGGLRLSVGMLADTEMVRAQNILDSVPSREEPGAKRSALADARLTQQRTVRSLKEIQEQFAAFRSDWELANMVPFIQMLAERQTRLAVLSQRRIESAKNEPRPLGSGATALASSTAKRQSKIQELCVLIHPAFRRIYQRLQQSEPALSAAFLSGADTLLSEALNAPLRQATEELKAGRWAAAARSQTAAAKELFDLHARLKKAQTDAARRALLALQEAAKSSTEAQGVLQQLKEGTGESGIKDFPDKAKIEEIVRMREVAGARRRTPEEEAVQNLNNKTAYDNGIDVKKLELMRDSGVRQDPNIATLGKVPEKSARIDPLAADRERNKVRPFLQEKFEDLVGKLLDELDEFSKEFQAVTLSTNQNNNDPGDIGKQGGNINSTGGTSFTGNKKPPTSNHGGAARMGRSGARAYGAVVGDQNIARKGRDRAQEGEQRAPDQSGTIREKKSDDPYTDTSTGVGGKKVESDDTHFSTKEAGKFTPDMLKRLGDPQKKNNIVERQGDKIDPRVAEMLRDLNSRQEQIIERIKAIKKDLRNLYLPTDHLDALEAQLKINLERLQERPDMDLFRLQLQTLDRLAGTVKVFHAARAGLQPSLPRERRIRGRVLDEPGRPILPGYEEAVKRYYETLAQ